MSLGDQLRYLRAMKGGPTLISIYAAISATSTLHIREIEQRYRDPSDDAQVEKLAAYYGVPAAELQWHRARPRKALSLHILAAMKTQQPVTLHLRHGETLIGQPLWWDLGAIGLQPIDSGPPIVVQRHAVIDWDSLAAAQ